MARAAGINHENVEIMSIAEKSRRAPSIDVETKVRAKDESGMNYNL